MSKPISRSKPACRPVSAMPTTPPAGPDRIASLPWNNSAAVKPARRHHEHQPGIRALGVEVLVHLRHIAPQDRRQIGVDHRGVAAADQLDQRRDFVADRHLREAHVARQRRDLLLVLGIAIGVHEHDRHRGDAVGLGRFEIAPHGGEIGRALDRAVGAHALVDLGDALVQHVGLDDVAGENLRPRLVADLERVAETLGDQQQRALALALEQRVGGDRRAHLDRADAARPGSARPPSAPADRGCPARRRRHRLPGSRTAACAP